MSGDLTELLGQSVLVDQLAKVLKTPGARQWLRGPSGSGKSTITQRLAERLKADCQVIRLAGDAGHAGSKYFALHRALAGTRMRKAVRDALQTAATAPFKIIPGLGGAAADWARVAVASVGSAKPDFLTPEQQDLLQGLQNFAGHGHLVIIVDDVGWLDSDTANLLLWLDREELHKPFPFAEQASVLFVETSDQAAVLPAALLAKLKPLKIVERSAVSAQLFPAVLKAFGLKRPLSDSLLSELYAISQGHLEIAKQIVKLDLGEDLASLLARGDAAHLMAELLTSRLARLDGAEALRRLLSIAACVGSAVSELELRCAFMDPEAFATTLEAARRENLLSGDGQALRFAHEVIRAAAASLGSPQAASLHAKLAACVKTLRPGDYASRLRHIRLSESPSGLSEMAFAVAMQSARGERLAAAVDGEIGPLSAVLGDLRRGYELMDAGEHRQAIDLIMPHYTGAESLVQAEVVVLLALNHIKCRTADAYSAAIGLLEVWRARRDEPEVWQRLMSALVTALAFVGQTEQASQLYSVLARDLAQAARDDPMSRTRLEALNRKADMFLTSEIAAKHIARAAEWFGPAEGAETPRHGFEYTACLVNLSGAFYTCGRFEEAASQSAAALRAAARLRELGLRSVEPYKALNNYVVASLRSATENPQALGSALDLFLTGGDDHLRDRALIASNRAVLALLAGDVDLGASKLEIIWRHVRDEGLDAYYRLYVGSNMAGALALTGQIDEARSVMLAVEADLSAVPKWFLMAHRRRYDFMIRALKSDGPRTPAAWDAYPQALRAPDGANDPWRSIGRGFLLSDIQVWSEG